LRFTSIPNPVAALGERPWSLVGAAN
jgi:hypothetical protein